MKEKIELEKIRDFEGIISDTLLFIKQNFKPLFKSVLILSGFFMVAGIISSVFTQFQINTLTEGFNDGDYGENVSSWQMLFGWRYFLMVLFNLLNYTALSTTALSYVAIYVAKGNVSATVEEVWSYFKYYFFKLFWAGILIFILWFVCFVCCFLPGLYVTPALFIFYSVQVLENTDFATAFSRCFALVKNNWWISFATIFVLGIITAACSTIFILPSYVIMMISFFTHQGANISKGYQIFLAVSQYVVQLFLVIPLVGAALMYFNLVERKESAGLLRRIANFGSDKTVDVHPEEGY